MIADLPRSRFSFTELAECAERELNIRRRVYPNRILTHRMSRVVADAEIGKMRAIGELLRALARSEMLV